MSDSRALVFDTIQELLAAPPQGESAPTLAVVEHTLTDGYAHALALEVERTRLQERLRQLASSPDGSDQLSLLAESIQRSEGELSRLRSILALLRVRAASMRAAANAA
jgi:hypothetical protein